LKFVFKERKRIKTKKAQNVGSQKKEKGKEKVKSKGLKVNKKDNYKD
jgi:hypothetical protein